MEVSDDVEGMAHVLISGDFESVYEMVEDVYRNFTSIYKAALDLIEENHSMFPEYRVSEWRVALGWLITFCRCSLKRIFEEDGITIRQSNARLLAKIELYILSFVKRMTGQLPPSSDESESDEASSSDENANIWQEIEEAQLPPSSDESESDEASSSDENANIWQEIEEAQLPPSSDESESDEASSSDENANIWQEIEEAYSEPTSIYCYQLIINYDLMMEFLDQCLLDWNSDVTGNEDSLTSLKQNLTLLRNYLELLTKDRIQGDNLDKLLIAVENAAYDIASYPFLASMYSENIDGIDIQSRVCAGVFKALVLQTDCFSCSIPLFSDELLIGYVKCVQDNILELRKNNKIDLTDTLKGQLMNLQEGLSSLTHLLFAYGLEHNSEQEKLSNIRLDLQALARNVGSVIIACFDNLNIENKSLGLSDLIEKIDVLESELIKIIFCTVFQETELESLKTDQLGSLILQLQNLKEFMDSKPGLIVKWKIHKNLIIFIFYLIHKNIRGGNHVGEDEFSLSTLHSDAALINHEELNGVLVSAQVAAFNIACYASLRRYGRFRWWELYSRSKENIDFHMRSGILKAIVLSSTTPLSDELLNAYGVCVQDNLIELLRNEAFDSVKDQFNILYERFSFLCHFHINCRNENEKLLHIKIDFQDLMRSLGSEISSCFSNWLRGDMEKQGSAEPSKLAEKMNLIIVENEEVLNLINLKTIERESPKTNQLGSLNLLLENWKGLMECKSDLIITWKDQFQMVLENLVSFKCFITSCSREDDESKYIFSSIMDAGYVAEYLLTTFAVGTSPVRCTSIWISELTERMERIKAAVIEVEEKKGNMKEISTAGKDRRHVSPQASLVPTVNEVVVGFEVETELIRKQLFGHQKQLDVISIVGMPGLGKTTLARKAYEDPFTRNHFDVRAWCCVSQDYNKKEMLLAILGSIIQLGDEASGQKESELSLSVHKQLKGRRYFIVLDDVWDIKALMYLKCFLPDDNNGSRFMLTSRSKEIGLQALLSQCHSNLIEPSTLTDEQSWDLLGQKVYNKGKCPPELCRMGMEIAKKCRGLPLAVVVIGGVLAKETQTLESWELLTGNLSAYLARDSQSQFMAAFELSYLYLPEYLKPMFLYLGAFPEDAEINVDTLMRLWMAEGFVENTESASLECQAEKSLMDLIDRSLVMVAKRRSNGSVKRCHVHDLLRDMCLAKAKEENFMQQVLVHKELADPVMYQRRLSISFVKNDETASRYLVAYKVLPKFSITPPIYSLLFYTGSNDDALYSEHDIANVISSLKLLKILDAKIFKLTQDVLDRDLTLLVHLRYLSIDTSNIHSIPSSISRLQSLETLDSQAGEIGGGHTINIPGTVLEMVKLRHLNIFPYAKLHIPPENSFILENLQTLSDIMIDLGEEEKIFRKVPSLKKLECTFENGIDLSYHFPNFESLHKLESLTVSWKYYVKFTGQLKLPLSLKKLIISGFCIEWSQISIIYELPNLEVLELGYKSVKDEFWDMGDDDVFTNLKVLRLTCLGIKRWSASSVNFPKLEKLVLDYCRCLVEIPSDLGEFDTLQKINVKWGSSSLVKMMRKIEKEQQEMGNESLKFDIHEKKDWWR